MFCFNVFIERQFELVKQKNKDDIFTKVAKLKKNMDGQTDKMSYTADVQMPKEKRERICDRSIFLKNQESFI